MKFPFKLNKYICYELTKAYQERNVIFVLKSSKKSMNLKDMWKFSCAGDFITSFADIVVITKQQAGSMRIGASSRSQLSGKMTNATQIRI